MAEKMVPEVASGEEIGGRSEAGRRVPERARYLDGEGADAHVIIRLLGFFFLCFHFLLLSWSSSSGGGRTSCWCSTRCWSRSTSPYIADEAPNVDIGQGLCKQARPKRFNIHTGCFNEGIDLILRDGHLIVVQNEGRVDAGELGDGGHSAGKCGAGAAGRGASRRMK